MLSNICIHDFSGGTLPLSLGFVLALSNLKGWAAWTAVRPPEWSCEDSETIKPESSPFRAPSHPVPASIPPPRWALSGPLPHTKCGCVPRGAVEVHGGGGDSGGQGGQGWGGCWGGAGWAAGDGGQHALGGRRVVAVGEGVDWGGRVVVDRIARWRAALHPTETNAATLKVKAEGRVTSRQDNNFHPLTRSPLVHWLVLHQFTSPYHPLTSNPLVP